MIDDERREVTPNPPLPQVSKGRNRGGSRFLLAGAMLLGATTLLACRSEADVASTNVSTAADNFEVDRRIVVYNGVTDKIVMTMEGRCSLGNQDTERKRTVTCKTGPNTYMKHIFQLSDNMFLYAEQLNAIAESGYHYRRTFTPQQVLPDIEFRGDANELNTNRYQQKPSR
jgi:hypothetical protein